MNAINKMYPTLKTATLPTMGGYSMSIAIDDKQIFGDSTRYLLYCYNTDKENNLVGIANIELYTDTEDILNQGVNTIHSGFKTNEGQIYFIDQFCRDNI